MIDDPPGMPTDEPRIAGLSTRRHTVDLPRPWGHDVTVNHWFEVTVVDTDGAVGTGATWTPSVGAEAVQAFLDHDVSTAAVGASSDPETTWDDLAVRTREVGAGGIAAIARAGLDLALWDLRARRQGRSVVDLIGRRRDEVEVYGSGVNRHLTLDDLRAQAARWVAAGHRAVKMKVGLPDLADDVARVAAVRDVIGPDRGLMVDANQRWDLDAARRGVDALVEFDLAWVEEPLPADDLPAHAELRAAVDVPIALGENLATVHEFRRAIDLGACDLLQPNVVRVGGITPFLRIADLADDLGVDLAPHLLLDLSGQLALCLAQDTMVEDVEESSLHALGLLDRPAVEVDGHGRLRGGHLPGLGLDFTSS